ncbi:MAG: hypothetical protein K8F91_24925, partial [Candidatus Obscuribacterales bacterium]|nr:hypothetical protein [Candidatus Obscuribacterales bacterium]
LFNELLHHQSVDIRGGARLILRMLWASPDEIPELNAPDAELEKLPDVKPSKVDSEEAAKRAELYFIDDESTTNRFELDADVLVAAPNLVVPRISDEESFRARISRKWKGIESRINKVLFPAHWYHVSMKEAEKLARQGKHEEASRIQLAVYASLSSSLSFSFWFIDVEFDLLIALGYSFAAQSNWNLAQNYFFLATKSLYRSKSIIAKERLTLLLAIVRALKGDLKDAQNLLLKDSSLLRNLSVLLPKEMKHSFVTRPEVLALFLDLPRASVEKLDQRELIGLAEAIICLHQSIKDRTSIRLDKQTLYVYFRLTSIRQTWRDWQKCALEFHQAVEVCRMVANKLSHDKQTGKEVVDGDLGALLSAAAMEPSVCFPERRHWRFFKYAWRMEVALTGLEKVEKFDNALLCDLYEYCGSQEWFANRLDYWLILAMKGGHKNSVEALKSILVNLSDHQTIVFCMQYLIDNGHYRDLLEVADGLRSSKGREVFVGLVIHAYRCGCLTTSGYLARSLFVSGNDFQRRQFLFMLMEEEAIGVLPYVYHQFIASSEKARVEALTSLFIRNLESTTFMSPRPMVFLDEYIRLLYKVTCSYIKRGQNPDADTFVESVECELSNSFGSR